MTNVVVVGLGEVGSALYQVLQESQKFTVYGYDSNPEKTKLPNQNTIPRGCITHICFPCVSKRKFVEELLCYIWINRPRLVIINSTVEVGTTDDLAEQAICPIAYSPIRGMHCNMVADLKRWNKYVACTNPEGLQLANQHFTEAGFKVKVAPNPKALELAKLFNTSFRVAMICFWQEAHRLASKYGVALADTLDLTLEDHLVEGNKPVHYPGAINGHCLIPNLSLLTAKHSSVMFESFVCSDIEREMELENPQINREVEAVKNKIKAFKS